MWIRRIAARTLAFAEDTGQVPAVGVWHQRNPRQVSEERGAGEQPVQVGVEVGHGVLRARWPCLARCTWAFLSATAAAPPEAVARCPPAATPGGKFFAKVARRGGKSLARSPSGIWVRHP